MTDAEKNNPPLTDAECASLVVKKISAAMAQGEQCMGMVFNKPAAEWKSIFNTASETLKIPVVSLEPLQGGSVMDLLANANNLKQAFQQAAHAPRIVLADASGNEHMKDQNTNMRIANYIEALTVQFPKAIYVQIIPGAMSGGDPVNMYCMKPTTPRDPKGPIYPV